MKKVYAISQLESPSSVDHRALLYFLDHLLAE